MMWVHGICLLHTHLALTYQTLAQGTYGKAMNYSPTESCLAFKVGTCLCGFGGLTYHLYALRTLFHQKYSACRLTRRPFSRINSAILTQRKPACGSKDCRRLNRQMLWSLLLHGVRAGATVTNMANNIKACLLQTELKTVQKHFPALQMLWLNNGGRCFRIAKMSQTFLHLFPHEIYKNLAKCCLQTLGT